MIIPAIDLQNGEAVRLFKGDFGQKTVYSKNPVELALDFEKMGARYLHIVDLDGAKQGNAANVEVIKKIRQSVSVAIQVGGGIRKTQTAELYLEQIKVDRIILGTAALENPEFVKEMLGKYGAERIVAGVDVRNGFVSTAGWLKDSGTDYLEFIGQLKKLGVKYAVVTDISKDGTLTSPNWDLYEKIKGVNVTVSGGVSSEADIEKAGKYYGVIVGKAYYEKKVDLEKALAKARYKKIVPCLDIKDGRVVKGVNFVDLADVGDPVEIAKKYEAQGADEIALLDITATNEKRETFYELIKKISEQVLVPIIVGGGISSLEGMRKCFLAGASKVCVNSAAVANPSLIADASVRFGKDRIIVAIDGKKTSGRNKVFVKGGKENTGLEVTDWAKKCQELGAGGILLTSMDADGAQSGYDLEMTKSVTSAVSIPVTASGGCGSVADIIEVFKQTDCDTALIASLAHFNKASVGEIKKEMERNKIPCKK